MASEIILTPSESFKEKKYFRVCFANLILQRFLITLLISITRTLQFFIILTVDH